MVRGTNRAVEARRPWEKRCWNDDLCGNMVVQAQVSYIDPLDHKGDWNASFDLDAE
jgi:hypothetical protein